MTNRPDQPPAADADEGAGGEDPFAAILTGATAGPAGEGGGTAAPGAAAATGPASAAGPAPTAEATAEPAPTGPPPPAKPAPTRAAPRISMRGAAEQAALRRRRHQVAAARADRLIAVIDRLLSAQVNEILHHPRFQRLEASWRGLAWLVRQADGARDVVVRVLGMSWAEIARDFERAMEFDQSQIFQKIYTEEFDMPGGTPYGLIVCDYEVSHHPRDVAVLRALSGVAAAAFSPVILAAAPRLFQLEDFRGLLPHLDLTGMFRRPDYTTWNSLRRSEDARFLGLCMPRMLLRLPYEPDGTRRDGFVFRENSWANDGSGWLWGNPAWAFAAVVIRSFSTYGWFGDLRGTHRDAPGAGLVQELPTPAFPTDRASVAARHPIEVQITERQERELSDLGFIPLQAARLTPWLVFHSNQSVQQSARYDRAAARANAKLSSMLQQLLCASRFAHFLKVIVRDKIGSFATAREIEDQLQKWLLRYCMANDSASLETKATYPLREGRIEVRELPGKPGHYACLAHLQPQFQLDEVSTVFRLVTQLAPRQAA